jgi:hypothetical protein
MSKHDRNESIRKLYEIDGWSQDTIASKYNISVRQVRRILKVDEEKSPVDALENLEKKIQTINYEGISVPKYALFKGPDLVMSSDNLNDFNEAIGVELSAGRISWIQQRLDESGVATMNGFNIKLSKSEKENKESLTLESLQKRVEKLEQTFIEIMQNTTDHELIRIIKKNFK